MSQPSTDAATPDAASPDIISAGQTCSMAYIVSQYPALSMVWIIREIQQLRSLGFRINVISVNDAARASVGLTETELEEAAGTYYIKNHGIKGALRAHLKTLKENPKGYLRGWRRSLQLGKLDLRAQIFNLMYFTEALMAGVWMKEKEFTHLHAHLGSQAATIGLFTKEVFGNGFSITVHGPDEFYNAPGQYLTEKVATADFICTISSFARSQLMKLSAYEHWHKIEVSRLGVNPEDFAPRDAGKSADAFEVVCVGRLTPAKGQHILVDAMRLLVEQGRKVRLRLVGDGEDREALERHVDSLGLHEQVVFEGAVNQDRIRDLYAGANAFAIPSFAEGIPVVLMEAMSMEIPCVTTRITGIPELIRDGVDGLLTTPSDVNEFAEAIARLMDDDALCATLAKNGRKRVLEHYHLEHNVDRLAGIFKQRLDSHQG